MPFNKISLRLLLLSFLFLAGCGSTTINVKSQSRIPSPTNETMSFGIIPINSKEPETERAILAMIQKQLEAKGLVYANKDPDFFVTTYFFVGVHEEYMPPTTVVWRDFNPDISGRRESDMKNQGVRRTEADRMASEITKSSKTIDGYVNTKFYQNIQVYFTRIVDKETVEIVWKGEVDSQNKKKNILEVAPVLLDELLGEFPEKTGKPEERSVKF
jgi:hypothetical protein